jgi:Uma2 family endonuclease
MISQDEMRVEHYHRQAGGHWLYQVLESPDDTLELSSVACRLTLRQIYERVNFEESPGD